MEFLMDNPFILFIIIAMLSSMFGKGKGKNQQNQQKQNQSRPRQAPVQSNPIEPIPSEARNASSQIKREYLERKRQEEKKRQEIKNRPPIMQEMSKKQAVKKEEKTLYNPSIVPVEKKPALSIEKQKLVDGVIWAEILGPPRALNPHRSINRKIK
ncbi:hypothetical protein J2Z40_002244 [Cytobacillus eiseniae]|uniref:Uncharacterized protein n=1 Tax=Cytobacillus eiseniae TaxID=762947 RepID=A0ABS4RFJ0_9BACI|nr:hypothetical protein [Cytobacillus eiseniae]MBP2241672.1 hypothetical protein [Cytobacillus eiseniae]